MPHATDLPRDLKPGQVIPPYTDPTTGTTHRLTYEATAAGGLRLFRAPAGTP
jgi:hypothetical protein